MDAKLTQRSDYTFKYNAQLGRHGWLRLTPAYSVKLVEEMMDGVPKDAFIFDPFSGTGTSGLVAAERGLSAHCLDINPFLVWLGNAKCRNYSQVELERLKTESDKALADCKEIAIGKQLAGHGGLPPAGFTIGNQTASTFQNR